MSEAKEIAFERRGEIAWLTIVRPEKANALTADMMAAMTAHLRAADADAGVRALVLAASGARAFSGGVDVRTATALPPADAARQRSERFFELLIATAGFSKPLIAALNGIASGGGAMLALLADRVVAVESTAFSLPEIDLGNPTLPGLAILSHLAGAGVASELVQTGRRMGAAEAHARGLIHEVVPAESLQAKAEAAALMLGSKAPAAFAANKRWVRRPLIAALEEADAEHARMRAGASPSH